jgi:hypothetical protein
MCNSFEIYPLVQKYMANDSTDDSEEMKTLLKKCPICKTGTITFEEPELIESTGYCDNAKNHEDIWDYFEIINFKPFTVKHRLTPLVRLNLPILPKWTPFKDNNLQFEMRLDYEEGLHFEEDDYWNAVNSAMESVADWMAELKLNYRNFDGLPDGVDFFDGEEVEEEVSEYILVDHDSE